MRFSIYLLAIVALLGGLLLFFKPGGNGPASSLRTDATAPASAAASPGAAPSSDGASTTTPQAAAAAPAAQVFDLAIERGRLVSGPAVIQVHQGDNVVIHLTADVSDELHLHGYNLQVKTRAGHTTTLQFTANRTGRFGYELHHANTELGALEVYPR